MNPQIKKRDGRIYTRGIEWTQFTSNIVGGCFAECKWKMPDGQVARCYAKDTASTFKSAYPRGFEHIYWRPEEARSWAKRKTGALVFMDSMSDFLGAEVTDEKIEFGLKAMGECPQHDFQLLTKNPGRYLKLFERSLVPTNVWCGASTPPDFIRGKELTDKQKQSMLRKAVGIVTSTPRIKGNDLAGPFENRSPSFLSIEPLSWHLAPELNQALRDADNAGNALDWAIIGAASNGRKKYPVDPEHLTAVLKVLDDWCVPVFFKGNLWGNKLADGRVINDGRWREFFPKFRTSDFYGRRLKDGTGAVPEYDQNGQMVDDLDQWKRR